MEKKRRLRVGIDKIPLTALLDKLDLCSLVALRTVSREFLLSTEDWASHFCRSKNWHRGDGLSSWVERLGRRVCVMNELSFVCLDGRKIQREEEVAPEEGMRLVEKKHISQGEEEQPEEAIENIVVASFSTHGSRLNIDLPGRYFVCGQAEDNMVANQSQQSEQKRTSRRRHTRELELISQARKRPRLAFQVRVSEGSEQSLLTSSIYCGVATASWARTRESRSQAVRSPDAWLLDLRRGRFVHAYPSYDRRVAAVRGPNRARALASTDDVIATGDVLGVQVYHDTVLFYKNGKRLAYGCGGRSTELNDFPDDIYLRLGTETAGWGRALPQHETLVPVLEIHARPPLSSTGPVETPEEHQFCNLEIEIAHWSGPATDYEHRLIQQQLTSPRSYRNTNRASTLRPSSPSSLRNNSMDFDETSQNSSSRQLFPPMALSPARLRCRRRRTLASLLNEYSHKFCYALSRSQMARAFISILPTVLGLFQLFLDLGALLSPNSHRRLRSSFNAFALSVAVSSVWKTHFYEPRRPQRSRRGIRLLLRVHFAKCLTIAALIAFVVEPRLIHAHYDLSACDAATTTSAAWLAAELAFELSLQVATLAAALRRRSFQIGTVPQNAPRIPTRPTTTTPNNIAQPAGHQVSRTSGDSVAAALRNFPNGYDSAFTTASVIIQFFAMIFFVPGSAQVILAFWSDRIQAAPSIDHVPSDPFLLNLKGLIIAIIYPGVAAWWCFSVFLRFGLLVFGLHTLFGFEVCRSFL